MAKRKVIPAEAMQDPEVMAALKVAYESKAEEVAGELHNQFVAFISASKVPLSLVLMVLDIVRAEAVEICMKHYFGEGGG